MDGRVSKARRRHSPAKLSQSLQVTLPDAVAKNPQGREESPESRDCTEGTTPVQGRKRRRSAAPGIDRSAVKRVRLAQTHAQRPEAPDEITEQANKTTILQPKPSPSKRPYASLLERLLDPVHSDTRPAPVHTFVSEWLESLGEIRCRSDSYLRRLDTGIISRQLTRSAPDMAGRLDAKGFTVPPTPASTVSRADSDLNSATSGSGRSGRSLVEQPSYRDMNLAANNVYMCRIYEELPQDIAALVHSVGQDRDSPGPSPDDIRQDVELSELWMGTGEAEVEEYFKCSIFTKPKPCDSLKRGDRQPMAKHTVPSTGSELKISTPAPDMLYGYNRRAFLQQQTQLISMGTEMVAKSLKNCKTEKVQPINSAAFSIAMNGTEARLYISWMPNELDYHMASVKSFLLQAPQHYVEFRKHVRNILDWGEDRRLQEIQVSLETQW